MWLELISGSQQFLSFFRKKETLYILLGHYFIVSLDNITRLQKGYIS